ncbi:hypothetical protein F3J34_11375 [Klebsiella sp. Ap-873]|nr:hypothetical protein [Klebsiella sp. Ap-873]
MALQNSNAVNITGGQAVLNYISVTSGGFNSTASNPLSIASASPTIKFTEAGIKDWFLVANGGSIRLQPDSTDSPDIAFSFNPATKLMSLMNVNATSLTLGTALSFASGGTGANNLASARTNLQVDRLIQNSSTYTLLVSPDNTRLVIGNNGDIGFQNSTGNPIGLSISGGGTGSTNVAGARSNLGLGSNNTPTFGGADLTTSGVANSGILTLNIANTSGATTSSGRLYHEVQNGVGKMTFHVSANGKNAYMQLDEDGKLIVPGTLSASGGITANSSIIAAQGQIVGLTTTSGGNKNIFLSNAPGDGSTGGWVNFVHGDWYSGYWNLGAVRGGGTDISSVTLEVNSQGSGSNAFRFYPSYGGHMLSPKGYTVNSGTAGSWGIENNYMVSAYYIPTVVGNVGGWTPFLSGGSTSTGGGYDTRIAFGALGAVNNWSAGVIKLLGDGKFHRAYQFGIDGSLYSWASPEFGSNLIFTSNATSDRTLKHDIQYTDGKESYERVKQWLPTMFKYNGQDVQRYGLIAQDLQAIDPQYVKAVPGSPIFEEVEEIDEDTGEATTVSKETGQYHPDTLSLDNNVLLTDLSCAFVYESGKVEKLQSELDELKALVQKLLDK